MIKKYYFFGNFFYFFCDEVCKNLIVVVATIYSRYTLTWNEGTRCCLKRPALDMIYPHMKWGNQALARLKLNTDDIPSYEMRERLLNPNCWPNARYTLTHNEGTPSVAIDFSYLKYIVVQPTQKPFTILVIYLICWKNARADYFCGFFYHPCGLLANTSPGLQPAKLRFALAAKKNRYRKICDT